MPIFSKPNAIIYIRRNGLVVAGKKLTPARMTFSADQLENMEVLDDVAFIDEMREFFQAHDIKGKHALMVLDDSVVFTKTIQVDADSQPSAIVDAFIEAMPLAPGKRACLRVLGESELSIFATNGDLYLAVADALDQAGVAKLLAITPAAAYPSSGKQQLAAAVQQYVNDTTVRSKANFHGSPLV